MDNTKAYKGIEQLKELQNSCGIIIEKIPGRFLDENPSYPLANLRLNEINIELYIYDEYEDFNIPNQLLHLCLLLMELAYYQDCKDILEWGNGLALNTSSSSVISYYRDLATISRQIEEKIGNISCPINSLDFELNAGAAQKLRLSK